MGLTKKHGSRAQRRHPAKMPGETPGKQKGDGCVEAASRTNAF